MEESLLNALDEAGRLRSEAEAAKRTAAQHAGVEQRSRLGEMADELAAEQAALRAENPEVTGTIEDVMVHRFGSDIIREPKRIEAYLALGSNIENAVPTRGKVPVLIVSTKIWGQGERDHTTALVSVDKKLPFYSSYKVKADQLMHAFTGSQADVTDVEMGLLGKVVSIDGTIFEPSTVKGSRLVASGSFMLNESSVAADGKGQGMGGTYAFSDSHTERLPEIDDEEWGYDDGRQVLVGWEEIRAALLKSPEGRRGEIARHLFDMTQAVDIWPAGRSNKLLADVFITFLTESSAKDERKALLTDPNLWNRS